MGAVVSYAASAVSWAFSAYVSLVRRIIGSLVYSMFAPIWRALNTHVLGPMASTIAPFGVMATKFLQFWKSLGSGAMKLAVIGMFLAVVLAAMIGVAVFMYMSFYLWYLPKPYHAREVYFDYTLGHDTALRPATVWRPDSFAVPYAFPYAPSPLDTAEEPTPTRPQKEHSAESTPPAQGPSYQRQNAGVSGLGVGMGLMMGSGHRTMLSAQDTMDRGPQALVYLLHEQWDMAPITHRDFTGLAPYVKGNERLLSGSQAYDVYLSLVVPDSDATMGMGVVMVRMDVYCQEAPSSSSGSFTTSSWLGNWGAQEDSATRGSRGRGSLKMLASSTRPLSITYSSWPVLLASKMFWMVPTLLGLVAERRSVSVRLFEELWEDRQCRAAVLNVTLSKNAQRLQIDSGRVEFHVQLHGLQYLMHHWFFTTAAVCVGVIVAFEFVGFLILSWWLYVLCTAAADNTPIDRSRSSSASGTARPSAPYFDTSGGPSPPDDRVEAKRNASGASSEAPTPASAPLDSPHPPEAPGEGGTWVWRSHAGPGSVESEDAGGETTYAPRPPTTADLRRRHTGSIS